MCQSLVDKVARSKQLRSVTDPELLVLFEDWLEELEAEVTAYLEQHPGSDAPAIAAHLGLTGRGAAFLVAKLRREEKI
ncbi:MAG: hypothetical protein CVU68_02300 [Deltaproteobacteria bacterium HGW-Deltaproteobacteria-3]|nr:MAG: hypothetical protein CVU68_02300 [Deltaproteobacteria bacterium HGW-Deltaproteobacteria-3]